MLDKIGPLGIVGILLLFGGIGLVASENLVIAGGIALVLAGLGLVVKSLVSSVLQSFGML